MELMWVNEADTQWVSYFENEAYIQFSIDRSNSHAIYR